MVCLLYGGGAKDVFMRQKSYLVFIILLTEAASGITQAPRETAMKTDTPFSFLKYKALCLSLFLFADSVALIVIVAH